LKPQLLEKYFGSSLADGKVTFERLCCVRASADVEFLEFLPHLLEAGVQNLGCESFNQVAEESSCRTLAWARPVELGAGQSPARCQMFRWLLLCSATKLRRFGVGAAGRDVATSNFEHEVTEGCNSDQPRWQTLCLGLTNPQQVT